MEKKNNDVMKISFKKLEIYNEDFFIFLSNKIKVLDANINDGWFGCFPILSDNNIINDIRLCVPKIKDKKTYLVNLHEYIHALDLYYLLNHEFEEEDFEEIAVFYEQLYNYKYFKSNEKPKSNIRIYKKVNKFKKA